MKSKTLLNFLSWTFLRILYTYSAVLHRSFNNFKIISAIDISEQTFNLNKKVRFFNLTLITCYAHLTSYSNELISRCLIQYRKICNTTGFSQQQ